MVHLIKYILDNLLEGLIDNILEALFSSAFDRKDKSLIY